MNIGFNKDATHTKWHRDVSKIESFDKKIIHPNFIFCDLEAEKYQFDHFFGGYSERLKRNPLLRIKNKLKRIFKIK